MSLDYETRFLGKEIVSVVANRVGKSSTAIGLAFVTSQFDTSFMKIAPALLVVITSLWLFISYRLVRYLNAKSTKMS